MKISVLGNIVETEYIYQVTPILIKDKYTREFKIKMFNQKDFVISLDTFNINNDGTLEFIHTMYRHNSEQNTEKAIIVILKYLNSIRDEVIKHWSNNQSDIPKIEFIN